MNRNDNGAARAAVVCLPGGETDAASALAERLGCGTLFGIPDGGEPAVVFGPDGVSLRGNGMILRGDLSEMKRRARPGNLRGELLVRAAGRKERGGRPVVLDAAAGLGEDSFLLAASGFEVHLYEYNPVTAALLRDSLARAAGDPDLAGAVSRMHLHEEDSLPAMSERRHSPDVVYLDPMFPERTKSGLIGKKLQLLQMLEKPCAREEDMLRAAFASGASRVIVKRPLKGPFLAGKRPGYSITGKAVRFDCYVPPERDGGRNAQDPAEGED